MATQVPDRGGPERSLWGQTYKDSRGNANANAAARYWQGSASAQYPHRQNHEFHLWRSDPKGVEETSTLHMGTFHDVQPATHPKTGESGINVKDGIGSRSWSFYPNSAIHSVEMRLKKGHEY